MKQISRLLLDGFGGYLYKHHTHLIHINYLRVNFSFKTERNMWPRNDLPTYFVSYTLVNHYIQYDITIWRPVSKKLYKSTLEKDHLSN